MTKHNFTATTTNYLADIVVIWVKKLTEIRKQFTPILQAAASDHRRDEDANSCSDKWRWVADAAEASLTNEVQDFRRQLVKVHLNVVLEYETTKGPCWFIWKNNQ